MERIGERVAAIHQHKGKILAYLSRTASSPTNLCLTQEQQKALVELIATIRTESALLEDTLKSISFAERLDALAQMRMGDVLDPLTQLQAQLQQAYQATNTVNDVLENECY